MSFVLNPVTGKLEIVGEGIQGATGVAGGPQGTTGLQGPIGATGIIGPSGSTGINGIQGETGARGLQGHTGIQGIRGVTGISGATGVTGATGPEGNGSPAGGNTYDILQKNSATDYDVAWTDFPTHDGVSFDLTANESVGVGQVAWNDVDGTLDIGLKGGNVILQVGQETLIRVTNQTGAPILNGTPVYISSVLGASGKIAVSPSISNNTYLPRLNIGLTTEDISDGEEGFVTSFGNIRGLNTTGSIYGESWSSGDIIYISETTQGYLTKFRPTAPNAAVVVGVVRNVHDNNGTIGVRFDPGLSLENLHNVYAQGPSDGDILRYSLSNGRWESTSSSGSGATGLTGATGAQGSTGIAGYTGARGATGIQGLTGSIGIQGPIGATGLAGTNGTNGSTGAQGATGASIIGATGASIIGATGIAGLNGSTGPQGMTGSQGLTGMIGLQGPIGATGIGGLNGAQGNTGLRGLTGAQGATGLAGTNGTNGNTGPQGATGLAGSNGSDGAQGVTGSIGIQGPIGVTGLQGLTGLQGDSFFSRVSTTIYPINASDNISGIGTIGALTGMFNGGVQAYVAEIKGDGSALSSYGNKRIELGYGALYEDNTYIDFHGTTGPDDYNARILRGPGPNGSLQLINTGAGIITITGSTGIYIDKHLNSGGSADFSGYVSGTTGVYNGGVYINSDTGIVDVVSNDYTNGGTMRITRGATGTNGSTITYRKCRGSVASPQGIISGDRMLGFYTQGGMSDGNWSGNTAAFQITATETYTTSARGCKFSVELTPNGSATRGERMAVQGDGTATFFGSVTTGYTGAAPALGVNGITLWSNGVNQCVAKQFLAGVSGLRGGDIVRCSNTVDNAVEWTYGNTTSSTTNLDPVGVVVTPGPVALNGTVWVAVSGQATVRMAGATGVRGGTLTARSGATGLAAPFTPPDPGSSEHWGEVGHITKNYATANATGLAILHFN